MNCLEQQSPISAQSVSILLDYVLKSTYKAREADSEVCTGTATPLRDTFTLEVPVVIRLTCDCAVADDAVMPIRAASSS